MLAGGASIAFIASSAHRRDLADVLCIDDVNEIDRLAHGEHEAMDREEDVHFPGSSLQFDEHNAVVHFERYSIHEILLARLTKTLPHKRSPIMFAILRLDSARPKPATFFKLTPMSKAIAAGLAVS